MIKNLQKIGGIAALGHTAALVVGIVLSFTLMFPLLNAVPDQAQKFLSDNQALVHLWNWIVDMGVSHHLGGHGAGALRAVETRRTGINAGGCGFWISLGGTDHWHRQP